MKIALVGCGSIGMRHHKILSKIIDDPIFTMCDIRDGYVNVDDVKDEEFDIVCVCTHSSNHIEVASKFKNSKSFFIEKPLDANIEIIEKNLNFFRTKKTMVACNLFFSKHMNEIKKHLPNVLFATIKYHSFLPKWRDNYYDLYSCFKSLGGGILFDDIHEVQYPIQILGHPNKITLLKRRLAEYTHDTEDYCVIILHYDDKIINIEMSYLCNDKQRTCDMTLRNGSRIIIDFQGNEELPNMSTVSDLDKAYEKQWKYFLNTSKPLNNYNDAYKLLKALHDAEIEEVTNK